MNHDVEKSLAQSARIASIGLLLLGLGAIIWGLSSIVSGFLLYRHSFLGSLGSTSYSVTTVEGERPEPEFTVDSNGNFSIRIDTNSPAWKDGMQKKSYTPPIQMNDDSQE